jgi:hypothetical protein
MVVAGIQELMTPAHKVVVRVWLAVFAAGLGSATTLFLSWPWILPIGILAAVLDYFSLQVVYAAADWFFTQGRHYEKAAGSS